ncbi:MAG: type III pantothenate kinase, partial [Candidatus Omnitrophota bacterium]
MLLAIDIGNTSISSALFKGSRIVRKWRMNHGREDITAASIYRKYNRVFKRHDIESVIIVSVVPRLTKQVVSVFQRRFKARPALVGKDIRVPIKNLYRRPAQVGQDRLVNAFAGCEQYGGGLIIIDFGTATTFDLISKKREYLGGVIVPGIRISLDALSERAALLPAVKLKPTRALIGKDTKASMRIGILQGYGSLCDGLVKKFKKRLKGGYRVIYTGGYAPLIAKYSASHDMISVDLTLRGLRAL